MDGIVSCVNVSFPVFIYRPYITILFFENVQVRNMKEIISAFPNLKYITLRNMIYFDCAWLKEIPPSITVATNMCPDTTNIKIITESTVTEIWKTGKFISDFNHNVETLLFFFLN